MSPCLRGAHSNGNSVNSVLRLNLPSGQILEMMSAPSPPLLPSLSFLAQYTLLAPPPLPWCPHPQSFHLPPLPLSAADCSRSGQAVKKRLPSAIFHHRRDVILSPRRCSGLSGVCSLAMHDGIAPHQRCHSGPSWQHSVARRGTSTS